MLAAATANAKMVSPPSQFEVNNQGGSCQAEGPIFFTGGFHNAIIDSYSAFISRNLTERATAMIIVRTIMTALPEKQKEVLQTLLSLFEPPGKEKGCLSYAIFSDIEDTNVFNLFSEWDTRQDLDQHIRSDRFGVLLGTKCLLSEPLQIKIATVGEFEGMEAVCSLRRKGVIDPAARPAQNNPA